MLETVSEKLGMAHLSAVAHMSRTNGRVGRTDGEVVRTPRAAFYERYRKVCEPSGVVTAAL